MAETKYCLSLTTFIKNNHHQRYQQKTTNHYSTDDARCSNARQQFNYSEISWMRNIVSSLVSSAKTQQKSNPMNHIENGVVNSGGRHRRILHWFNVKSNNNQNPYTIKINTHIHQIHAYPSSPPPPPFYSFDTLWSRPDHITHNAFASIQSAIAENLQPQKYVSGSARLKSRWQNARCRSHMMEITIIK